MKKKSVILLLAVSIVAASVTGCGKSSGGEAVESTESTEVVDTVSASNGGVVTKLCDYDRIPVTIDNFVVTEDDVSSMTAALLENSGFDTTLEETSDEAIAEAFADYGISSKEDFTAYIREYLGDYADSCMENAISGEVEEYLLKNCTVELDESYVTSRTDLYQKLFTEQYVGDASLDEYLSSVYDMTTDEAYDAWYDMMSQQVTLECILGEIADAEGMVVTDDDYSAYLDALKSDYPGCSETEIYEMYGYTEEDGEVFFRARCLTDKMLNVLASEAEVSYAEAGISTEESENSEISE